jgi:hypothetical protein
MRPAVTPPWQVTPTRVVVFPQGELRHGEPDKTTGARHSPGNRRSGSNPCGLRAVQRVPAGAAQGRLRVGSGWRLMVRTRAVPRRWSQPADSLRTRSRRAHDDQDDHDDAAAPSASGRHVGSAQAHCLGRHGAGPPRRGTDPAAVRHRHACPAHREGGERLPPHLPQRHGLRHQLTDPGGNAPRRRPRPRGAHRPRRRRTRPQPGQVAAAPRPGRGLTLVSLAALGALHDSMTRRLIDTP